MNLLQINPCRKCGGLTRADLYAGGEAKIRLCISCRKCDDRFTRTLEEKDLGVKAKSIERLMNGVIREYNSIGKKK